MLQFADETVIIPHKRSLGGYIGVNLSVGRSICLSVGPYLVSAL